MQSLPMMMTVAGEGKQRYGNSNNFYWICNLSDIVTELFSWSQWRLPYFTFPGYWYIFSRFRLVIFHPILTELLWLHMSGQSILFHSQFTSKEMTNEFDTTYSIDLPLVQFGIALFLISFYYDLYWNSKISLNNCTIFTYLRLCSKYGKV